MFFLSCFITISQLFHIWLSVHFFPSVYATKPAFHLQMMTHFPFILHSWMSCKIPISPLFCHLKGGTCLYSTWVIDFIHFHSQRYLVVPDMWGLRLCKDCETLTRKRRQQKKKERQKERGSSLYFFPQLWVESDCSPDCQGSRHSVWSRTRGNEWMIGSGIKGLIRYLFAYGHFRWSLCSVCGGARGPLVSNPLLCVAKCSFWQRSTPAKQKKRP